MVNRRPGSETGVAMSVEVKKFKGEKKLRRGIERMTADGWTVQSQSSRKRVFSLLTGFFTRKQIHTVTFTKENM